MALDRKKILIKLDRFCAWALVGVTIVFFISGYGMTKGVIPVQLAEFLHDDLLPMIGGAAFAVHSAYGMHISLKRWRLWGPVPRALLILYAAVVIIGVAVLQYVVRKPGGLEVPQTIDLG
ncbi:MAG: hypothetical protein ACM3ZC_05745 [Bacteroidota bacterium]